MSIFKLNTDGMTKTQIEHVEHLEAVVNNFAKSDEQWRKKSLEDWDNLEAMTKRNEEIYKENKDLKNRLSELQEDFAWSQIRIDSKNRKIERLEKYESQFVED